MPVASEAAAGAGRSWANAGAVSTRPSSKQTSLFMGYTSKKIGPLTPSAPGTRLLLAARSTAAEGPRRRRAPSSSSDVCTFNAQKSGATAELPGLRSSPKTARGAPQVGPASWLDQPPSGREGGG